MDEQRRHKQLLTHPSQNLGANCRAQDEPQWVELTREAPKRHYIRPKTIKQNTCYHTCLGNLNEKGSVWGYGSRDREALSIMVMGEAMTAGRGSWKLTPS